MKLGVGLLNVLAVVDSSENAVNPRAGEDAPSYLWWKGLRVRQRTDTYLLSLIIKNLRLLKPLSANKKATDEQWLLCVADYYLELVADSD